MEIEFDRPRMEDLPQVLEMIRVFGSHYGGDASDPGTRAVMAMYVQGERKGAVVARDRDRLAGFAFYDMTPIFAPGNSHGRGDMMVVRPEYRQQRIARELLHRAWQDGAERGLQVFFNKSSEPIMIDYFRRQRDMNEQGVYFYKRLASTGEGSR